MRTTRYESPLIQQEKKFSTKVLLHLKNKNRMGFKRELNLKKCNTYWLS